MCRVPDVSADARLALARAAMRDAVDALAALDPAELAEGSLGDAMLDLLCVRRQIDGSLAMLGGRFSHSSEWAADGSRSAQDWVRGKTSEGFGSVRAVMATAHDLVTFPEVGEALRRGDLGVKHVQVLAGVAADYPRLLAHLQAAQTEIVELAIVSEPPQFRRYLTALCLRLDPMAAAEDRKRRDREFYFRASVLMDGQVRVDGMLPADVGGLLVAALESARRDCTDEAASDGAVSDGAASDGVVSDAVVSDAVVSDAVVSDAVVLDAFGRPITGPQLVDFRAVGQCNVEALHRILSIAANVDGGLSSVAGQRPSVSVTIPLETLTAEPGESVVCGWLERFGVPSQPISTDTARRLACDSSLRPLVVDSQGQLVVFGSASRVIAPSMRALVVRRDRHCRFSGCRARIDEVHHVIFFSHGGPTRSDNLLGLCWHHHHLVHEGGWQLAGDANADIKGTGPDGRVWTTGPPGG